MVSMKLKKSLNEYASKQLISTYGVPVLQEIVAQTITEVCAAALKIGFPVVLKGLGSTLLHKTERSLVHLNITRMADLKRAALAIVHEARDELEGILVQPYLKGRREFVAGFSRDPQFGPVVMFGVGGIFTEAFEDVVLRIAPLDRNEAEDMLNEIRAQRLLGPFRGEKAVDRKALVRSLMGLSRLAIEHPEISEIDVNPLLVSPMGEVCAVDAMIILSEPEIHLSTTEPIDPKAIGSFFYPKSIAIIGASSEMGKWGHRLLCNTISGGYPCDIYLVNKKGGSIIGRPVYKEISEVPGQVDLAVITIPANQVIGLLPQLNAKGIKKALLISSGFAETGKAGKQLQRELIEKARQENVLILGPNTMGISNPHINLYCTATAIRPNPGVAAIVSQSGNIGTQLFEYAEEHGLGLRCFCGSGNEAMITMEDFLDGFEMDDLTLTVMLYIEGIHDGRRFFESARRLSIKKPILLFKGGQSEEGNRAVSSHTGAMTSDVKVFDAACKQAGIIKVEESMDLLDLSAAFSSLPLPMGNRVAIMTFGGGWGVITTDLCARYGLMVPQLSPELIEFFDHMLPPFWSRSNPLDVVGEFNASLLTRILEELIRWDGCDSIINLGVMGLAINNRRMTDAAEMADPTISKDIFNKSRTAVQSFEQEYVELTARLMEMYRKPVYGVNLLTDTKSKIVNTIEGYKYRPIFYKTPERAVKANARMYEYQRFLNGQA